MYRAGLEWILGFRLRGRDARRSTPASRAPGRGFEIAFRYRSARYEIAVENPRGVSRGVDPLELDGGHHRQARKPPSRSSTMEGAMR